MKMRERSPWGLVLCFGLLLACGPGRADPVQGGVLGGAVGGAVGGPAGAVAGALLGGAGGARAKEAERQEQERWKQYYEQQEGREPAAGDDSAPESDMPSAPLPTGSGLIKEIQRALSSLGYQVGTPDGLADGLTVDAIRAYQEDQGLTPTGKPTQELLQHLREKLAEV